MAESGTVSITKAVLRSILVLIGAVSGYQIFIFTTRLDWFSERVGGHPFIWGALCVFLFTAIGFIMAPLVHWGLLRFGSFIERRLQSVSYQDLVVITLGLFLGLLLANLLSIPFYAIPGVRFYVSIFLNIVFVYLMIYVFMKRRNGIWLILLNIINVRDRFPKRKKTNAQTPSASDEFKDDVFTDELVSTPKILDTSALIDGRILEVAQAGFLEGTVVLPRFVLAELQGVADSSDPIRRSRGRRGLSVVTDLQKLKTMRVEIPETTLKELEREKVDEALVVLGRRLNGKILTTDYNLNQIARIEGVDVLNVNDLSNALKPMFLPGEIVNVEVTRSGKEAHQGIAYLDDGTMLVVEDGERSIGKKVLVTVTSMLQTAAGRMVFGRIKKD